MLDLDFNNTEIAFRSKSDLALRKSQALFRAFGNPLLVKAGPKLVEWSLGFRLPVTPIIKATIFDQFCGGESIADCGPIIEGLRQYKVATILDYSVEGREREEDFDQTTAEVLNTIAAAAQYPSIRFAVFKVTGLARFALLAKANPEGAKLTRGEQVELDEVRGRVTKLCRAAAAANIRIMIDAEETWVQDTIDRMALDMMREFNRKKAVVYNTVQMYRHDRLQYLESLAARAQQDGFLVGVKLVRGAYMEKERLRVSEHGLPSPIQPDKASTDRDYTRAMHFILERISHWALCAGTHNEESCKHLALAMRAQGLQASDERVEFSQLLGMSDHLTYILAHHGFNVSKYVPYGPVRAVLPYLFRRAEENSSIKGQASRELQLIEREIKRRST